jgi:hypothetical protein
LPIKTARICRKILVDERNPTFPVAISHILYIMPPEKADENDSQFGYFIVRSLSKAV